MNLTGIPKRSKDFRALIALIFIFTLFLTTCKSQSTPDMPRNKTSRLSDRDWKQGPDLQNPDQVLDWILALDPVSDGSKRRIRLPIYVQRGESPLDPNIYTAGVQGDLKAKDRLDLRLDDTGLGIPLSDRILQFCKDEDAPCIILVEGTWGPLLDLPGQEYAHTIALIHVLEFQGDPAHGNAGVHVFAEE